jgi:dienelactone hydrolase
MGPYPYAEKTYRSLKMHPTDRRIDVAYPADTGAENRRFPLIVFMHGLGNDGFATYGTMMHLFASWGYVVAAPRACKFGCLAGPRCQSKFGDPPCFADYYKEVYKAIDFLKTVVELPINHTAGVGIAGHSMGGQAALFAAAHAGSKKYDIRAAVLQHPYTHDFPAIGTIPLLVFTGDHDPVATPKSAHQIFDAPGADAMRGLVESAFADHGEPSTYYRPQIGLYTTAWFKIFLERTPSFYGVDFQQLLIGEGSNSLCDGGDGLLTNCTLAYSGGSIVKHAEDHHKSLSSHDREMIV